MRFGKIDDLEYLRSAPGEKAYTTHGRPRWMVAAAENSAKVVSFPARVMKDQGAGR
jgi:hypothetical protein